MIGAKLAHYEITGHLGTGGMGEVYQATDAKLGRSVAIKLLPEAFTHDIERVARFEREARVLASLNHPNIAAIYGVEESGGRKFLVMELVPGETMAEKIKRGAIPVEVALTLATQITDALEAAHEKGVIHRDLKPANVKVTPDGQVKVLDFGLAKALVEPHALSESFANSPTLSLAATQQGVIQGTAAYMSPEQAQGLPVDKRTDIFAFGAVVYEMLSGRQAFGGNNIADIFGAVLKSEPDWTLLPANLPERIRELLRLCLQKDAKKRRQTATDVRIDIEQGLAGPQGVLASDTPAVAPLPFWKRAAPALATLILGAVLAMLAMRGLRPVLPTAIVTKFSFPLGEHQLFTNPGRNLVAISPSGTQILYVANRQLYLRPVGDLEAKVIRGSEDRQGLLNPVFSPDGDSIAFVSLGDNMLKRIAVSGGAATSLCPASTPYGISWSEDGILFGQDAGIMKVSPKGGKPELLVTTTGDEVATAPQMLPGGKSVLFTLARGTSPDRWDEAKVVVETIGTNNRTTLFEGGSDARYLPGGYIVYAFSGTLRAVPFDLRDLKAGSPLPVIEGVRRGPASGIAHFSFSDSGSLVYLPGPVSASRSKMNLARIDMEGKVEPLNLPLGPYSVPRVSPDGEYVAYQADDGKESIIRIYHLSDPTAAPLILTNGGKNRFPVWSGDSKWVAFQSDRKGDLAIFKQRADRSGMAIRLTTPASGTSHVPDSWYGDTLLFEIRSGASGTLSVLSLSDQTVTAFGNIQSDYPIDAVFSPDGHWVAYHSHEDRKSEVLVQPFPPTGDKGYQIPIRLDNHNPVWSPDLNRLRLFYVPSQNRFAAVDINVQPFAFTNAVEAFRGAGSNAPNVRRNFDIMRDGKHILAVIDPSQDLTDSVPPQINVILNWFDELKSRMTVRP